MKSLHYGLLAAALLLAGEAGQLQGQDWGLGVRAGTAGVGIDVARGVMPGLAIRAGYSHLVIPYTTVQELEGYRLQADAKVQLGGAVVAADWYPWKNNIRITGGLLLNRLNANVEVSSLSGYLYGDILIPAADVGTISAVIRPALVSPYLAAGYGLPVTADKRVTFQADLGIVYHGKPRVSMTGSGVIGPMAGEMNQVVINNFLAQYRVYPMLNAGIRVKIGKPKTEQL
jgi:hypothetical protein